MLLKRVSKSKPVEDKRNYILEHNGKTYEKRDAIGIKSEPGRFKFWYWEFAPDGKVIVCCLYEAPYAGFRFFYSDRIKKPRKARQKRIGLCDDHPVYQAVRRPRGDCKGCWLAYDAAHPPEEVKAKKPRKATAKTIAGHTLRKA